MDVAVVGKVIGYVLLDWLDEVVVGGVLREQPSQHLRFRFFAIMFLSIEVDRQLPWGNLLRQRV